MILIARMSFSFEDKAGSFWVEEINGQVQVQTPMRKKRKVMPKKREYDGWGSTSLIRFLESIGKDTSKQITQHDVTDIINKYVKENNLVNPVRKKRIICDERLRFLFGRKTISRLKVHDLLESHFAENHEESSDDLLFNSEDDEDEDALATCENQKTTTSVKNTQSKKMVTEKPKSCFAAIVPFNIKLVYLKKSLVEDLLKDPETFETKVVGSFIRIRCDPNDYLQKNSHQLLQVTGVKKGSGMKDMNGKILLQVSGFIKDISIHMLSDDNFSEEECKDLHQRVKDGLLKRPMIVDLEQTARVLHEDITKHWLAREITLLQNLIDRANEKGWRKELDEYLRKREKLQSPDEQARLLHEIPQAIADDLESESMTPDVPDKKVENNVRELWQTKFTQASLVTEVPKAVADDFVCEATTLDIPDHVKQENNSPKSTLSLSGASKVPLFNVAMSGTVLNCISHGTVSAEHHSFNIPVQQQPAQQTDFICNNDGVYKSADSDEVTVSQGLPNKQVLPSQVIELSDDEENEEPSTIKHIPAELLESLIWHYRDPRGHVQGPFSITSLKRWSDASYFSPDFKVWMEGQSQDESVLLVDILHQFFPS